MFALVCDTLPEKRWRNYTHPAKKVNKFFSLPRAGERLTMRAGDD